MDNIINKVELSLVIPVINEEQNIVELSSLITKAFADLTSYEVIWVDDGSRDKTLSVLRKVNEIDKNQKYIALMRNSGQSTALMAGIDNAMGQYIATLDGDLQNFPADIIKMYNLIKKKDLDMVVGWRKNRWKKLQDSFVRRIPSLVANFCIRTAFQANDLHDAGCPVKIAKANLFKEIRLYGELHRFIAYIALEYGAKIMEIEVQHADRKFGKSNYGLSRTFKVLVDILNLKLLLLKKTTPTQLMAPLYIGSLLISLLSAAITAFMKIYNNYDITGNPLFMLSIVSFLMSFQFIIYGFLGELLLRAYYESGSKKTYLIREQNVWPTK